MAGTATVSSELHSNGVAVYTVSWTSSAGGDVSDNPFSVMKGRLCQVRFVPGDGGDQPSDLYDVTLVDQNGVDLLSGQGANQSNASAAYLTSDPPVILTDQTLDVVVANAGNAKSGTVTIWIQR